MDKEIYLIYHPDKNRYVAFTDRNVANEYGKAFDIIQAYVVPIDPEILRVYRVLFYLVDGTVRTGVKRASSLAGVDFNKITFYAGNGAWGIFVKAFSEEDAVAVAQAFLTEKISSAKGMPEE